MCFRNCWPWYAAIFESHANNPKPKTDETGSRFVLNSSVKQLSGGESLPKNQNINQAEVSFCGFKVKYRLATGSAEIRIIRKSANLK